MYDFDEEIDRRGSQSDKWDNMEANYGISPDDGLPMWVAETDFRPPSEVNDVLLRAAEHGIHGYFADKTAYHASITNWMQRRHNWIVQPNEIATVHGIVSGVSIAIRAFSEPGDGVILITPVYHAFARIINATRRRVVEAPVQADNTRQSLDLESLAASLTGNERILIFCSPHNPGGRVWSVEEQREVAKFCADHDLVLISDEIHHDIIHPGYRHTPMTLAAPEHLDRIIMMSATTKVFNIAGALTGNVIIQDKALRARFAAEHKATGTSVNRLGVMMATAAYDNGDAYVDALCAYLAENARVLSEGVGAIPGVRMIPMEATYLAWVDFSDTGMSRSEINQRVEKRARIATSHGPVFGTGGEGFLRINIGTTRARVHEAVSRMQDAFSDLQ